MDKFCKYLKEIAIECNSCFENGIGACHIKVGQQKYYSDLDFNDTIQIIRHDHRLTVETDIEVIYKTEYPWGSQAGKGPEFAREQAQKDKTLRDYLEPKLPTGAKLLRSHEHYNPEKHNPNIVALHIHAHKQVEDLDEAKLLVRELAKAIRPRDIEKAIGGDANV